MHRTAKFRASRTALATFLMASTLACLSSLAPSSAAAQTLGSSSYVPSRVTMPVDNSRIAPLLGNVLPLARPQFDRGPAPAGLPMTRMLLVLRRSPDQEAALRQMIDAQQDKTSPNYHKWLTPEQFGQQFGPSDQDIQQVTDWLQKQGFSNIQVGKGRTAIEFSGTAGLVKQALHTEIHKFAVNGEEHWANSTDPSIPAALLPVVAGIDSLNSFPRQPALHVSGVFQKNMKTGTATRVSNTATNGANMSGPGLGISRPAPLLDLGSGNNEYYAVGPYDFATIYNSLPLWNAGTPIDGTGQTIAIVGQTDINPLDFVNFRKIFGLPIGATTGPTGTQYLNIIYNGPDPGITGDEVEADLDTQWSGAVAKGATIDFVTSQSTESTAGIDLSALYIIDNNLAPVMSESYGSCELQLGTSGNQFYNSLWQQAAAQGITVMVSTGDTGAAGCDYNANNANVYAAKYGLAVSGIASTPYNVAVGGTDFNQLYNSNTSITPATYWNATNAPGTQESAKGYIQETTWNNTCTNQLLLPFFSDATVEALCNDTSAKGGQYYGLTNISGGSGGASNCITSNGSTVTSCTGGYAKPSWQTGTGVPADKVRDLPDVSLFASNGFQASLYPICEQDISADGTCDLTTTGGTTANIPFVNIVGVGGTSASSPAFAGIMSLVNQKTGQRQGNANYVLYNLAAKQNPSNCNSSNGSSSSCVFNDVTNGTISQPCVKGSPNCTTTNSADTYGILSGYTTGVGYDLATGLGSVNVANLVNNWNQATFTASTATLALNPTSLTHGAQVTATVNVTSGSGTPTGDVSINSTSSTGIVGNGSVGAGTLSSGSLIVTIPSNTGTGFQPLPGGSYNVSAHYAGDGTFAPVDSNSVAVVVTPEASTTTVQPEVYNFATNQAAVQSTATYGNQFLIKVSVAGASGQGFATGNIALDDNGASAAGFTCAGSSTPGTCSLNSIGNLEFQTTTLSVGTHSYVASYPGDPSFNASTSVAAAITVTKAATTAALTADQTSIAQTGTVNLTATISTTSYGNAPTGTITFYSGTTAIGSPVTVSNGYNSSTGEAMATAKLAVLGSALTVGTDSLTAVYNGDGNYLASTSAAVSLTVTTGGTSTPDFTLTPAKTSLTIASGGTAVTDTMTIGAVNGFTGSVSFSCTGGLPTGGSCAFSPATVSNSGNTTLTITIPTAKVKSGTQAANHSGKLGWLGASGAAMACLLLVGIPGRRRWSALLALLLFAAVAGSVGCGGGGSSSTPSGPTTSPGTYNITVSATSGTLTHTATIALTVQ
ncbi:MAG: Ig-like domain repeat protein [Acidobacteriaceae bacterium]